MFTGIIEEVGEVMEIRPQGGNIDLLIRARMVPELRVDQSVSHNGVCLTVVELVNDRFRVTAVKETLERSNIGWLKPGDGVNLERSLRLGDRLDGHMVQGHVDTTTRCTSVKEENGSWSFGFALDEGRELVVQKGSICINGTSLTVAALTDQGFSVVIIPYTFAHTTFGSLRAGDRVNLEFDVLGKYVQRMLQR